MGIDRFEYWQENYSSTWCVGKRDSSINDDDKVVASYNSEDVARRKCEALNAALAL